MATLQQLQDAYYGQEFHYGDCKLTVGPRGGKTYNIDRVRKSGQVKTWKTRPGEFSAPFKYGFRESFHVTPSNISLLHPPDECPIRDQ